MSLNFQSELIFNYKKEVSKKELALSLYDKLNEDWLKVDNVEDLPHDQFVYYEILEISILPYVSVDEILSFRNMK